MAKLDPWSHTYSGRKLYYDGRLETHSQIIISDIAHHLAMTNRYGGATHFPYSVAQHSSLMAVWVYNDTGDPFQALDALMHDASEYAVTDLRKMLKDQCPEFMAIEDRFDKLIRKQFHHLGVPLVESDYVKSVDSCIVKDERAQIMVQTDDVWFCDSLEALGVEIVETDWQVAKLGFLSLFDQLTAMCLNAANPSKNDSE